MADPVVIKKYGNRRLYDTERSGYITLADLEQMVREGRDVKVVDAKSGEDLTKLVLVQIIAERDAAREVLPLGFLKAIVQHADSPERGKLRDALSSAWGGFVQTQTQAMAQMTQAALAATPWAMFGQSPLGAPRPASTAVSPADVVEQNARRDQEIADLKAQLGQTNELIHALIKAQAGGPEGGS